MAQLSSEELSAGIRGLANDIVDAMIHWRLSRGILGAMERWPLVAHQSSTFWSLTIYAHVKVSVLAACRAFDQEKSSLHLLGLLRLIQQNLSLFEEVHFRERLRDNPFVASLAEVTRQPDATKLKEDLMLCSAQDPLVKRLVIHRNTAIAHLSQKRTLSPNVPTSSDEEITAAEFEELLRRAVEILNRYSYLFNAEHFSTQIVGHDDHETIFRWIQDRVEADRSRYDEQDLA